MTNQLDFIYPDWPAVAQVKALTAARTGGFSRGPYESFNLADHVGDAAQAVRRNRALLRHALELPSEPLWLKQVHGTTVIDAATAQPGVTADGAYTRKPGVVLAVLTADCLPVFLCDRRGTTVALLHAGWRGLAAGIIEAGVRAMQVAPGDLLAWLGPAIGPDAYEVGGDVRDVCVGKDKAAEEAFQPGKSGRWLADLYLLARHRLSSLGVEDVSGGDCCTARELQRFFSYRRDGTCGRMASLTWLEPQ